MSGRTRRGLVYGAFLGASLSVALVGGGLASDYWLVASAVRTPDGIPHPHSHGRIRFGLFHGVKELNVGYGWRVEEFSMRDVQRQEPLLDYWAWATATATLVGGLLAAAASALAALAHAAAAPPDAPLTCACAALASAPALLLANSLALLMDAYGAGLWTWQYFKKLTFNVMSLEDRKRTWTSEGLAYLGLSYWCVVGAVAVHLINIILIYSSTSEARQKKATTPVLEEKPNGNIMLY